MSEQADMILLKLKKNGESVHALGRIAAIRTGRANLIYLIVFLSI